MTEKGQGEKINYFVYNTDHIKMHPLWLSSRQDKISIKLVEHEPIIKQKIFPLFF